MEMNRQTLFESKGFTIPEVIVAGTIMIVLCVGTLSVFSYIVRVNRGNALRTQALSVLQQKVEYYRSLKFVPGAGTAGDLPNHRPPDLYAGTHTLSPITTPDGRSFTITAEVTNLGFMSGGNTEENCLFKSIRIVAVPTVTEREAWLQSLHTDVTIQRVRSN
jgi:type II secretory pathway pseudopilin PulG